MGAWGVGHQANDTALDYIGDLEGLKTVAELSAAMPMLNKPHIPNLGVLGVAEYLLDHGVPHTAFEPYRHVLDKALNEELCADQLDCWSEPEERRVACDTLAARLNGVKVDQAAVDATNEGLLSKILGGGD